MVYRLLLLLACLSSAGVASAQLPVVPGAPSSYGMNTRAAYACGSNPTIYRVTSLADSGTGTLRNALQATGPRVVIFETSGYITITSDINISTPCLTVATQTAPAPGITLRSGGSIPSETGILLNTHDVLWQHMAIRPGSSTCNSGLQVYGGDQYNIVFDHMSFSWGQDENLAFNWTNGQSTQATVWRSIMAEGLLRAPGSESCTGGGASNGHGILIDTDARHVAVIQSLFASNYERNPYMLGRTQTALVNNLVYQWHGPWGFFYNNGSVCGIGCGTNDPWYSSAIGNRFVRGPNNCCTGGGDDTSSTMFVLQNNGSDAPDVAGNRIYRSDNTIANQNGTVLLYSNGYSYDPTVSAPPSQAPLPTGLVPLASTAVEAFVTANAGARPAERDAVDTRIVAYVLARGGAFISSESDVGGYPSLAVNTRALTPPANAHVVQASGYTALEEWLQGYARIVEGGGATAPVGPPNPPTTVHVAAAYRNSSTGSGTSVTPADDLQALVTAGVAGQVFSIGAGTYRMLTITPKSGQVFIGEPGAILSGARLLTGATGSSPWYYTGQTQEGTKNDGGGQACLSAHPCQNPEDVFFDDAPLEAVSTLGAGGTGKFFFDYAADRIYIWDDPSGHTVETSVTPVAFTHNNKTITGVTISNLVIEKYAAPTQTAAVNLGPGWVLQDSEVRHVHGAGVDTSTDTTPVTVQRSHIHHNGYLGFQGSGGPIVVKDNEIDHNNYAFYNAYWSAGGSKWVFTHGLTVSGNFSHHNNGPGLWTDINNINTVYENNTIEDNQRAGILHEISYAAVIRNNTVNRNGLNLLFPSYPDGSGISVVNSTNVEVSANTLTDNWQAIGAIQDTRQSGADTLYGNWEIRNLNVHDNTIIQTLDRGGGEGYSGVSSFIGNAPFTSWNVHWTHNHYTLGPHTNYFLWLGAAITSAQWVGYGMDVDGTFSGASIVPFNEFVGPFPSWVNVKTDYGAVGDGSTDDAAAFQTALDALGGGGPTVLYVPAGTYKINSGLTMTDPIYVSVVGEDPTTTTLLWGGSGGGTMLALNGIAYSRIDRLTFDGNNVASIGIDQSWDGSGGNFDTGLQYEDDYFRHLAYGIYGGFAGSGFAEVVIRRNIFDHMSEAGVALGNPNALDIWVWDSLFDTCKMGITNALSGGGGSGNFHAYRNKFLSSTTADLFMGNTGGFSARGNYSKDSTAFFVGSGSNNPATVTIQGNTILDPVSDSVINMGNQGPGLVVDNVIRSRAGSGGNVVRWQAFTADGDVALVGNTFTVVGYHQNNGRLVDLDNTVVARASVTPFAPADPVALTNYHRTIYEVASGSSAATIQGVINTAVADGGVRDIVHIPYGNYSLSTGLTVAASDIQIVGDGFDTKLNWSAGGTGPMFTLAGPTQVVFRELRTDGNALADGVLVQTADQVGGRVYLDQLQTQQATGSALWYHDLDNLYVQAENSAFLYSPSCVPVQVTGGSTLSAGGAANGRVSFFSGLGAGNNVSINVSAGGKLLLRDIWYESGAGPGYAAITGRATFTMDNALVSQTAGPPYSVDLNGVTGRVAILQARLKDNVYIHGSGSAMEVLALGLYDEQYSSAYYNDASSPAASAFLNLSKENTHTVGTASVPTTNVGSPTTTFLRNMLAHMRTEVPLLPSTLAAGLTDVRMFRVALTNGRHNLKLDQ